MKKSELEVRLRNGEIMDNLFHFRLGQDCYMFKADIGEAPDPDEIIYIPDVDLNEIPLSAAEELKMDSAEEDDA